MSTPINDRDLTEEIMASMMRLEEEAYRAGQHGCCEEGVAKMANQSCFGACEAHGPRSRAALSLLCHALAQWAERIVEEAAQVVTRAAPQINEAPTIGLAGVVAAHVRALAPRCPKCHGWGAIPGKGYCDCSRGKAYRHWETLSTPAPPPSAQEALRCSHGVLGGCCDGCRAVVAICTKNAASPPSATAAPAEESLGAEAQALKTWLAPAEEEKCPECGVLNGLHDVRGCSLTSRAPSRGEVG